MKEVTEALLFAQLSLCLSFTRIQLRYRLAGYMRSVFPWLCSSTHNDNEAVVRNVRFKGHVYLWYS